MVVAAGAKRLEIFAAAGLGDCIDCQHTTMHFVVGFVEHPHSIDTADFEGAKLLMCDVCRHTFPLKESDTAPC